MSWFWGRQNDEEEEEDSEEEYSEEDFTDDDEAEILSSTSESSSHKKKQPNGVGEFVVIESQQQEASDLSASPEKQSNLPNNKQVEDDKEEQNRPSHTQDGDVLVGTLPLTEDNERPLSSSSKHSRDSKPDEQLQAGVIPEQILGIRERAASELTVGDEEESKEVVEDTTQEGDDDATSDDEEVSDEEGEEEDEVTSMAEKQSLLVLAAEHDRVDILQAILTDENNNEDREALLHQAAGIPPLHIAVSYGSTSATQCLLRMGADPSLRPNVAQLEQQEHVDIPHIGRFDGVTAWELAFGGGTSCQAKNLPVDMAPSKREAIRHAFTAEALRCIGSDEVERLRQLVNAGMPSDIDIGGKTLYDWSVEMSALQCEELLRPTEAARYETTNGKGKSAVLDRPSDESAASLMNRLEELESLAKALSTCLDNLAEEVSVCHGLLLMGGGASALASHVRSLKALKERKLEELSRMQDAWENSEDELAYWVRECGPEGERIAAQFMTPESRKTPLPPASSDEEKEAQRRQLQAQIAASESKIRKLRVSIADLSEENTRDLQEVERRGLSGGISMVRGLREEIREIEFELSEAKNGEATCRIKISLIQSKLQANKKGLLIKETNGKDVSIEASEDSGIVQPQVEPSSAPLVEQQVRSTTATQDVGREPSTPSERISSGHSTAIALRQEGRQGFFPLSLWQILLRIIGIRDDAPSRNSSIHSTQPAVII